ncbi:MAG: sigma-70 family RNA polymerase sigma factor, partial [Planctomycetota bacterium]
MPEDSVAGNPESLLDNVRWVQRLARRLVLDESQADDLSQETLLAALKNPSMSGVRAWLGTVTRFRARSQHRVELRRRQRELRAARQEKLPSQDEVLERAELHRRLVESVLELKEPFRSTLLLRFFEGLSTEQIARQMQVSPATVRGRKKRALEQLRERLDRDFGERKNWAVAMLGLAALPKLLTPTVPAPGATATTAVATQTVTGLAVGGLLMSVKSITTAVCASLLLAGGAFYFYVGSSTGEPTVREAPRSPAESPVASRSEPETSSGNSAVTRSPELKLKQEPTRAAPAVTGLITGRVTDEGGQPLEGIVLHAVKPMVSAELHLPFEMALPIHSPDLDDPEKRGETNSRGEFRIPDLAPGLFSLLARGQGYRQRQVDGLQVKAGQDTEVELELREGFTIEGIVVDPAAVPVADAEVRAWTGFASFESGTVRIALAGEHGADFANVRTVTDRNGRFSLEGLASGNHSISASHPDWASGTVDKVASGSRDVHVPVTKGGTVSGLVLDAQNQPVRDAKVSILQMFHPEAAATTTDKKGRFTLERVTAGNLRLRVNAAGYPPKTLRGIKVVDGEEVTGIEAILAEGGSVTGVVLDPQGRPLADAKVRLGIAGRRFGHFSMRTSTDEEGRFEVSNLRAGESYGGEVAHDAYLTEPIEEFSVTTGVTDLGTLMVRKGGFITGRVLDANNAPVVGARVDLASAEETDHGGFFTARIIAGETPSEPTLTDEQGAFKISPVAAGEYRIRVHATGYAPHKSEPITVGEGAAFTDQLIILGGGAEIVGTVMDLEGNPLSGATVEALQLPFHSRATATTDSSGSFRIAGLEAEEYQVSVSYEGLSRDSQQGVRPGGSALNFVLKPMGSLSGVVLDKASGQPVQEFRVKLSPKLSGVRGMAMGMRALHMGMLSGGSQFQDPNGEFQMADLEPGTYTLEVRAGTFVIYEQEIPEIRPGENLHLQVAMELGGALAGRVVDRDGNPVSGARVKLDKAKSGPVMRFIAHVEIDDGDDAPVHTISIGGEDVVRTDAEGHFLLTGLPEGEVNLAVVHDEFMEKKLEKVEVIRGETRTIPKVTVERGGTVHGTVFGSDGNPTSAASVLFFAVDEDGNRGQP